MNLQLNLVCLFFACRPYDLPCGFFAWFIMDILLHIVEVSVSCCCRSHRFKPYDMSAVVVRQHSQNLHSVASFVYDSSLLFF